MLDFKQSKKIMEPWNIPNLGPQMQTVQSHNKIIKKKKTFFREDVKHHVDSRSGFIIGTPSIKAQCQFMSINIDQNCFIDPNADQ